MHVTLSRLGASSVIALLCGAASCGIARPRAPVPAAATADSASAFHAAVGFLAAFDSLQWEPFRSYLANDVTVFLPFPQAPRRVDGREAVEAVFRPFFDAVRSARSGAGRPPRLGIEPRDLRIQMAGSAVAIVTFHLGSGAQAARRTLVFLRGSAGDWKLIHWHASSAPAQPAPPARPPQSTGTPRQDSAASRR